LRVVLDTNVLVSGLFFSGPPYLILEAWRSGYVELIVSPEILEEYGRVGELLQEQHPQVEIKPFLSLLMVRAEIVLAEQLPEQVCEDSEDDKFISCALSGGCEIIISGDKLLRKVSGYRGVRVLTPREFLEEVLQN